MKEIQLLSWNDLSPEDQEYARKCYEIMIKYAEEHHVVTLESDAVEFCKFYYDREGMVEILG